MKQYHLVFFLSLILFSSSAFAELYECNGTWTNRKCDDQATSVLKEVPYQERSLEDRQKDMVSLWLHDLRTLKLKANKKYDTDLDISDAIQTCTKIPLDYAACRKIVSDRSNALHEKIDTAKVAMKKAKEEKEKKVEEDYTTIVRIEDGRFYDPFTGYYYHRYPYSYRYPHRNKYKAPIVTTNKPKAPTYTLSDQLKGPKRKSGWWNKK